MAVSDYSYQFPNQYLTYSVQDAPDTSIKAYLNAQGHSNSFWNRTFSRHMNGYNSWVERQNQNYDNYLKSYDANYNSEYWKRMRLEGAGFSGQYLANGIGGATNSPGVGASLLGSGERDKYSNRGLNRVMQSLELMSSAGIAMKNFGEGKAAMRYADDLAKNKSLLDQSKYINEKAKYDGIIAQSQKLGMEWANPADYGYKWNSEGKLEFVGKNGQGDTVSRNMYFERLVKNLDSQDLTNALRQREVWLKDIDYSVQKQYAEETAKAQKELLENKRDIAAIEKDYAAALKAMGVAAPIIGALMKLL